MNYDVIVIGGGPAGIFAAVSAKQSFNKVLLIEKNRKLGKKMLITGGGRCNFTNISSNDKFIANIPNNGKFLYSILNQFSNTDLISFVKEKLNIEIKVENDGRVFPSSEKSISLVNSLVNYLKDIDVEVIYDCKVEDILTDNSKNIGVLIKENKFIYSKAVILATGGLSYPETGSTGDGYSIAKKLDHKITDLFPSSTPLISKDLFIINKELQGLSLKNIKLYLSDTDNRCIKEESGDIIFTHYGISGPAVLKISRYVSISYKKNKNISLKLLVDIFPNKTEEELIDQIKALVNRNHKKNLLNGLKDLLPEKLLKYIININNMGFKRMNELTLKDMKKIINNIKSFTIHISDTKPIEEAMVTGGGIDIKQINPKTLESKLIKGLFFAGEILDIDANTGGYNLQIAFSTGYVAGTSASKYSLKVIE